MPSPPPDPIAYVAERGDEVSAAAMLDRVRAMLADAWDHGREPTHIVVSRELYRALEQAKARELSTGIQLTIFGLPVVGDGARC